MISIINSIKLLKLFIPIFTLTIIKNFLKNERNKSITPATVISLIEGSGVGSGRSEKRFNLI